MRFPKASCKSESPKQDANELEIPRTECEMSPVLGMQQLGTFPVLRLFTAKCGETPQIRDGQCCAEFMWALEFKGKAAGMRVTEGLFKGIMPETRLSSLGWKEPESNGLTSLPDKDPSHRSPNSDLYLDKRVVCMYGRYATWEDKHHSKGQVKRGKARDRRRLKGQEGEVHRVEGGSYYHWTET